MAFSLCDGNYHQFKCKEQEKNNRMGKTRDPFKKIRDTKGTFHAKMGSIKDRNGMDLTEEKILRSGGKNAQKNCTKSIFMTQIITMVWSFSPRARHPRMWSQVLLRKHHYKQSWWRQWNFSWVFSNPKRWCCQSAALNMPENLENSAVATVFIPIPKKGNAKECSYYCTIAPSSHTLVK